MGSVDAKWKFTKKITNERTGNFGGSGGGAGARCAHYTRIDGLIDGLTD